MKKITKKLIAIFAVFALTLAPLSFVGCGNDNTISDKELNEVIYAAANDIYSKHTEFETFEDITYHWTEHTVETTNVELDYKNAVADEETTQGTFVNRTETTAEYWVAIKKDAERLIAKYTMSKTTVATTNEVDLDEVLQTETETTLDSETVTLAPFTIGTETVYGSLYERSTKVGDEDAVITKNYYTYSNEDSFADKVRDKFINEINERVGDAFFMYGVYRAYYNMGSATKDGNKVVCGNDMQLSSAQYGNAVMYQVESRAYFVNRKIDSAKTTIKTKTETSTSLQEVKFDYTNSATIDVVQGDVTGAELNFTYSYSDHASDTSNLPYVSIGVL